MICVTSARGKLLNVSIAINRPIVIACYALFIRYFSLVLLSFLFIVYFCVYVFFSFDANILAKN